MQVSNKPYLPISKSLISLRGYSKAERHSFRPESLDQFDPDSVDIDEQHPGLEIGEELRQVYLKRNGRQAEKNPSMAVVMKDPQAFFDGLRSKFEAQKTLTPEDPYSFDMSEYGLPVLEDIQAALSDEIELLQAKRGGRFAESGKRTGLLASLASGGLGLLSGLFGSKRDSKLGIGLDFLESLRKDVKGQLDQGSVSYKKLNEIGYFSSRALGAFDGEDLSVFDRNFLKVDRLLLGYKNVGIEEEFRRYQDKDFEFFRRRSPVPSTNVVQDAFTAAFRNPDRFEMASLPVARSLGPGVFMQLVAHDIFLMGIAPAPEAADGFNRPAGDFYLHDARHASAIFTKRKLYEKQYNVSPQQRAKLEMLQSKWKQEMIAEKKKLNNKELSYAIGMVSFNHHHDRGIPQVPSSFVEKIPETANRALYRALKASGQPIGFQNPKQTIGRANEWLRDFWLARLPEEDAVLAASR